MSRRSVVLIVALLTVGVVALLGYRRFMAPRPTTDEDLETVAVLRGTLVATVSAAGSIEPAAQVTLTFQGVGRVAEVKVEEGDQVRAGQVLARLDTTDLELQVAQARLSLATAEAQLAKTKAGPTAADLAAAQAGLESARENLAKVKAGPTQEQLAAAEAALKAAEDTYQRLLARPDPEEIEQAKLNLDQARNSLWAAQAQRDSTCGAASKGMASQAQCDQAEAQVLNAEVSVRLAEIAYQQAREPATAAEIQNAAAQVERARDELERLRESPTAAELAAAEAQVAQAEAQLEKLTAGPTAEDLAIAEAQVEQARLSLQQAERRLEEATLRAPFAGTVALVGVSEGEWVTSATPMIVLVDLSRYHIDLTIDETEIGRVRVGQGATVTLDAFPDQELRGTVSRIAPTATIQQGVVTYNVRVDLAPTELAVKPGMTANADIVVARKEKVLLVPNRAIRSSGGRRVVEVLGEEGPREVPVEVGLRNERMTEILSGLSEGQQVVISIRPTSNFFQGGFRLGPARQPRR